MGSNQSDSSNTNEQRLHAILDAAIDAIITIDERGIIQTVNQATTRLFGYDIDEIVGKNVSMLMPTPYAGAHDGYLANYRNTGEKKIIGIGREVVARHKSGMNFPIDLSVSEVFDGDARLFLGIVRDISARKEAEELATSLGRILEESFSEIFIFDAESLNFILVNQDARENLGYSMDELLQMTPVDIKPEYSTKKFAELVAQLKSSEQKRRVFETIHQRKDGSRYDVEIRLQMDQFRGKRCCVAFIQDVTDRKHAEASLAKLNEELEQRVETRTAELKAIQKLLLQKEKLATLGQVSGGIAHEIRNPLNAVKTSAFYLLEAKNASREKQREHLERIDRQVTVIDNVITALSDVAKMPKPRLRPFGLPECIANVLKEISIPQNIEVNLDVPSDLPKVMADEHQLPIVFRNLVRNARDAMPEGGKLLLSASTDNGQVLVCVEDNGVGIPPDQLERITEPMFSTKARGMGLGLSISRAILEKNRGRMLVNSELGKGSQFTVVLQSAEKEVV